MARPYAIAIESSEVDRAVLLGQSHRRETAQALALWARIVLACADSTATHAFIAEAMGLSLMMGVEVSPSLCSIWPVRPAMYTARERLERFWTSRSRPSSPRRWRPCQKTPPAGPPVQLAAHLGLSQTTVSRILACSCFGAASYRRRQALHRPVLRRQGTRHRRTPSASTRARSCAVPERKTFHPDAQRHGTTDLVAAFDVKAGMVIAEVHRRHCIAEFLHFLQTFERATPVAFELRLVLDNASPLRSPNMKRWLLRHPRVHMHSTSASASWINLVGCWFSILTARRLKRGRFRSTRTLENAIRAHVATNVNPKPFIWTKNSRSDPSIRRRVLHTDFWISPPEHVLNFLWIDLGRSASWSDAKKAVPDRCQR